MKYVHAGFVVLLLVVGSYAAQNSSSDGGKKPSNQRSFAQPVSALQAALKKLPGGTSGALPVLDGFVVPRQHTLDSYQRPYYECLVRITPSPSGGSLVRVTAKITAWNRDPAHSGYEIMKSNGRIEADLLDRLQAFVASTGKSAATEPTTNSLGRSSANSGSPPPANISASPEISAPMPQFPNPHGLAAPKPQAPANSNESALEEEARNLEAILRNQSHPTNLTAVKQDRTPVLQAPSSAAKVLFLASVQDEFEVLDLNPEWVHVRISGLSRGWVRRSSVEILDGSENGSESAFENKLTAASGLAIANAPATPAAPRSEAPFSVSSEELGSFPGDWAPLKGKNVKIISVQQIPGTGRISSPRDKLHYAESLFKKEDPASAGSAAGLVLIFDSEDGGMVAATSSVLAQWRRGAISEQLFWKQCWLDPPEILGSAN